MVVEIQFENEDKTVTGKPGRPAAAPGCQEDGVKGPRQPGNQGRADQQCWEIKVHTCLGYVSASDPAGGLAKRPL